jgi:malonate transporter and related proteins
MELFLITIPVFIVIALGYGARSFGLVPKGTATSLSNYVYYFALPAYIILEVGSRPLRDLWETNTILAYSGGMIVLAILMWFVGKLLKFNARFTGMMTLNVIFGSVAYVGVPFTQMAFGRASAPTVSILIALTVALSVFWAMVIGVGEIELGTKAKNSSFAARLEILGKRIFGNPLIIALMVAILFSGLSLNFPKVVQDILKMFAITAGPVALFAEGAFLQGKNFWADWKGATVLSLLKLIALPFFTLIFLWLLPTTELNASISLVQAAMPVAATNFIFAQQFKIAPRLVAASTLLSVIISFFTLTGLLYILPLLGV